MCIFQDVPGYEAVLTNEKEKLQKSKGRWEEERRKASLLLNVQVKGMRMAVFSGGHVPTSVGYTIPSAGGPFLHFPCLPLAWIFFSSLHWTPPPPNSMVAISMCHLSFLNISDMQYFIFITTDYVISDKRTHVLTLKFHSTELSTKQVTAGYLLQSYFHTSQSHWAWPLQNVKDKGDSTLIEMSYFCTIQYDGH